MRKIGALVLAIVAACPAQAGPLSKFDGKPPAVDAITKKSTGAVERCLIDTDGQSPPFAYRQADQPGKVTLIWTTPFNVPNARADIEASASGTHVRAWGLEKQVRACIAE